MKIINCIILSLFLFVFSNTLAQTSEDINDLKLLFRYEKVKPNYRHFAQSSNNEIQGFVAVFFLLYKETVSSQDGNRCTFYPSCSTYAVENIRQSGLLKGSAAAADRLTRCHHGNEADYPYHEKTGLKFDPIQKK